MPRLALSIALVLLFTASAAAQEFKWFHQVGWYPFTMQDKSTGAIYGASVDLMAVIGAKLNTKATFYDVPWNRGFLLLEHGDLDICAGAYANDERRGKYLFSPAIFKNETRIFVKTRKRFSFDQLSDLKGKRLGKPLGASFGEEFDAYARENIHMDEPSEGNAALITMLLADRFDGFLMDRLDAAQILKSLKLESEIVPLERPVNSLEVYLLVSKKSPWAEKMPEINQEIQLLIDSGELARIFKKY